MSVVKRPKAILLPAAMTWVSLVLLAALFARTAHDGRWEMVGGYYVALSVALFAGFVWSLMALWSRRPLRRDAAGWTAWVPALLISLLLSDCGMAMAVGAITTPGSGFLAAFVLPLVALAGVGCLAVLVAVLLPARTREGRPASD